MNTDEEREQIPGKLWIVRKQLEKRKAFAKGDDRVSLTFSSFSSSVFICVHPWFPRFSPCE
jgi:hypothetical protein